MGANPTRQPLQPEAIGAVMEATKWLKPSISVSRPTSAAQRNDAMCHKPAFHAGRNHKHPHHANSSSKALACFKSNVSKPSVNQP